MIIKKTVKLRNNNERIYLYIHTYTSNYCKLITVIDPKTLITIILKIEIIVVIRTLPSLKIRELIMINIIITMIIIVIK